MIYLKKIYSKNKIFREILILLFFLLLSIAMTYPLWHLHRMTAVSDWSFHASRVQEIYLNLKRHSIFTFIASSTFHSTGVASFLFYPTTFLYPWALLRFLFSPITSFYIWYTCFNFLTLLIAYLCMKNISSSTKRSLVFSILYTLSAYRIYIGATGYVLGEFIASTFLPLAFFGLYKLFYGKNHDWIMLAIGMGLIIHSHILSVFITAQLLAIFFVVQVIRKKVTVVILINLLKAIILTVILSLDILYPFLTDYVGHGIRGPYSGIGILDSASDFLQQSLANNASGISIGLVLLVVLFTGWSCFARFNFAERLIYITAIFMCIVATSIFPWLLITSSIFGVVQLPWRYLSYASLFLSVVGSKMVTIEYRKKTYCSNLLTLLVTLLCIITYFGAIQTQVKDNSVIQVKSYLRKNTGGITQIPLSVQLDNNNYNFQFGYGVHFGETDYYPKKAYNFSKEIQEHILLVHGDHREKLKPRPVANGIKYKINLRHNSKIDIPVLKYSNTVAFDNGRKVQLTTSHRGTPLIKAKKGMNSVLVKYVPGRPFYFAFGFTIIVWLLTFIAVILMVIKKYTQKLS